MRKQLYLAAMALCPGLTLTAPIHPSLSGNETRLICGDKSNTGGKSEGWNQVPMNQALFALKNALQSRGYLSPTITQSDSSVNVEPGPLVHVTSVQSSGDTPGFDLRKKRHVIGEPMTPDLLTSEEKWVKERLAHRGYPCSDVKATGDLKGVVTVTIRKNAEASVSPLHVEGTKSLDPKVLRRFDPFEPNERYDDRLLAISTDRAVSDGIVERSFFSPVCPAGGIRQDVVEGQSRILTLGVSLNTEEIGVLQASIERVRIGENASSAFLGARATYQNQQIDGHYDWHLISPSAKGWLRPELVARHENENSFDLFEQQAQLGWRSQWDWLDAGFGAMIGPEYDRYEVQAGSPARDPQQTAIVAELTLTSHGEEFNRNQLGPGFQMRTTVESGSQALGSNFGATRVKVRFEKKFNPDGFDPPFLLIGFHAGYSVSFVEGGPGNAAKLPPDYYGYLGGNSDVRGFGRMEVGSGYANESLSSGFASLEISPDLLGGSLRPFIFADAGLLSYRTYGLQAPVFWSPGAGIDWKSPVGTVHGTAAHGVISGNNANENPLDHVTSTHWQFYLSLGEPL